MLRNQEQSRKTQWLVLIGLMMLVLMSFTLTAAAYPNVPTGRSGISGSTCASCHGAVSSSRAIFTGPATVAPGSTNTYTFSGPGTVNLRGMNIAATGGTLIAGASPQSTSGSEIITTSSSSTRTWTFTWTAPMTGSATIYGAGVDGYGGTTYTQTLPISVAASASAPSITTQPANQTVTAPQTASFSVAATGTAPLSYQWRKGGVNIAGATSSSYTTPATTTADNGALFSVVVSNGTAPNATSSNATLTVNAAAVAPSITTQPANRTVTAPQTATFSVTATGTAPLSYQWRKGGVNIAGATSSSYTTPATTTADNGALFSVVVSNGTAPNATSSNATLTVNAAAVAPSITTQPANRTVTAPQTATFSVTATGTAPLSYQWRKGGVNIAGATSSSYTTPATTTADNGALFSVVVSNGTAPNATSSNATLTVNAAAVAPSITTQPANRTVTAPQTATFSVTATGTAPLSYQWRKGGVNIAGATSSSYTTPATTTADNGALFSVVVSNGTAPNATSNAATLTVNAAAVAPSITTQPANRTVTAGQTATFSVTATGTAPLSYQWRKGGVNIAGATSSSYTTPATTTADNGALFSVVVSNGTAPNATSSNATLTVNAATSPTLTVNPSSVSFSYAAGTATGSKTVSVASTGAAVPYTASASGGSWLSASGAGNTPGTVTVSVNIAGMAAGTYTGSVTVAPSTSGLAVVSAVSAQTVPVTLTVTAAQPPSTGGGKLLVSPTRLVFYANRRSSMSAKTIAVKSSTGSKMSFTAEAYGGNWISVTPSGGTTPGTVTVAAYATGMHAGTYSCVVRIKSGTSTRSVAVVMVVSRSRDDDDDDDDDDEHHSAVAPFTFDPGARDAVNAGLLDGAGVQVRGSARNQGLVLSKNKSAAATALSGATINVAAGSQLSQLGFDLLAGSECTAQAPQFVVISDDQVEHVANCANGSIRRAPATGWTRVRFNPTDAAQLDPPLQPGTAVTTIALVMDHVAGKGIAVLDNININGSMINK